MCKATTVSAQALYNSPSESHSHTIKLCCWVFLHTYVRLMQNVTVFNEVKQRTL